jgi:hypothetical protein
MDVVALLERQLGRAAVKDMLPMEPATADVGNLLATPA